MSFEDIPEDREESYQCECGEGSVTKHEIGVCCFCGNEQCDSRCNNCGNFIKFWRCDTCNFPEV